MISLACVSFGKQRKTTNCKDFRFFVCADFVDLFSHEWQTKNGMNQKYPIYFTTIECLTSTDDRHLSSACSFIILVLTICLKRIENIRVDYLIIIFSPFFRLSSPILFSIFLVDSLVLLFVLYDHWIWVNNRCSILKWPIFQVNN